MTTTDTLCAKPWTHIFVANDGRQLPCCFAQSNVEEVRRIDAAVDASPDLHGLWNSPQLRDLRLQMIRGERPPICSGCFISEDAGCRSPRQDANEIYPREVIEELLEITGADGSLERGFRSIDLRLGNECNLTCRMCSPHSSRKLIREWSQTGNPEMIRLAKVSSEQRPWGTRTEVWDSLLASGNEVESIHFAGGEPTLIDEHYDFLRKLIEAGRAGRIRLSYSTNLTVMLPDLEKYLGHFKAIHMIGSLDGYADVNSYIRFPAKWDHLIRNLEALSELASRNPALSVDLHTTIQAYNLTRITELLRFLEDSDLPNIPAVPDFAPVVVPAYFNPRVLSPALKVLARDRFLEFRAFRALRQGRPRAESRFQEQRLDELGKILSAAIAESAPKNTLEFLQITRFFDRERRHKLTEVIPEFQEMFSVATTRHDARGRA
ncbi:MAG: twitch domain-containing radical SAM protein [Acidobacteriota bacterium]